MHTKDYWLLFFLPQRPNNSPNGNAFVSAQWIPMLADCTLVLNANNFANNWDY